MIKVTLGEHNRCNKTHRPETRFVVNVVAHNFTYLTFRDDIAVLKLNEEVKISDTIKPVCLPRNDGKNILFLVLSTLFSEKSKSDFVL